MAVYEIPLTPQPQSLSVRFPNGVTYGLRLLYLFTPNDCWELDINDVLGNPIVCGVPLVTGADLLAQYAYLNLGCKMFCTTDASPNTPPRFFNLGKAAHLWLEA